MICFTILDKYVWDLNKIIFHYQTFLWECSVGVEEDNCTLYVRMRDVYCKYWDKSPWSGIAAIFRVRLVTERSSPGFSQASFRFQGVGSSPIGLNPHNPDHRHEHQKRGIDLGSNRLQQSILDCTRCA